MYLDKFDHRLSKKLQHESIGSLDTVGENWESSSVNHVLLISLVCLCSCPLKVFYIGAWMGTKLGMYYKGKAAID